MTGDWTQRARASQYQEAVEFLKRLPCPIVSIPGNHDIPLYNVWKRFTQPLHNYNQFIRAHTQDFFCDSQISLVGIQTPTRLRTVEGRVAHRDYKRVQKIFNSSPAPALRILACHHPLRIPKTKSRVWPFFWVKKLLDLKPHLVLSGHAHKNWIECDSETSEFPTWHISAGSATSNRLRGEANSFHIIDLDTDKTREARIQTYFLAESGFIVPDDSQLSIIKFANPEASSTN